MVSRDIKFDMASMGFMSMFGSITKVQAKDCFESQGRMVFIVPQEELGKAIGNHGANVRALENRFKKKIKIVGFSDDVLTFVKNYMMPLRVEHIEEIDGKIIVTGPDQKTKGLMIGRNGQNLRELENVLNRYFKVEEVRVV